MRKRDIGGQWLGAGLASVGLLLGEYVESVLVPSTHQIKDLFPWGSHPLLDPLWSSDDIRFIHDGAHLTRIEKIAMIVRNPTAMRHLRVCNRNYANAYNCGRCDKCVRTMIGLALVGGLEACRTLPHDLDDRHLRDLYIQNENQASFARESLDRALEVGNADIAGALKYKLWSFETRQTLVRLREQVRQAPLRLLLKRLTSGRGN